MAGDIGKFVWYRLMGAPKDASPASASPPTPADGRRHQPGVTAAKREPAITNKARREFRRAFSIHGGRRDSLPIPNQRGGPAVQSFDFQAGNLLKVDQIATQQSKTVGHGNGRDPQIHRPDANLHFAEGYEKLHPRNHRLAEL